MSSSVEEIEKKLKEMEAAEESIAHNRLLLRNWRKLRRTLEMSLHRNCERKKEDGDA